MSKHHRPYAHSPVVDLGIGLLPLTLDKKKAEGRKASGER